MTHLLIHAATRSDDTVKYELKCQLNVVFVHFPSSQHAAPIKEANASRIWGVFSVFFK